MNSASERWSYYKHKPLLVLKLVFLVFFVGIAFRLLISSSNDISPVLETPLPHKSFASTLPLRQGQDGEREPYTGKCDIFTGEWKRTPSGPVYSNKSCPFIEEHQNCMKNGRPDTGYLYWKWNPHGCEIRQFDAGRFLDLMRNKTWALIGDSISRNHGQSLVCMLSTVELAVLVRRDEATTRWHFPLHNFTISVIWSPFLVEAAIDEDINGNSKSDVKLYLDKLDKTWIDHFHNLDFMIISTGNWFLKHAVYYERNRPLGCHYCSQKNLVELGFEFAFHKVLRNVLTFIAMSKHEGMIFFRPSTPDHFENGEWFSGGTCKRTKPVKEGEIRMKDMLRILRTIELEEFEKAAEKASNNGVKLRLLDMTILSLLRPDGHPGPYREFYPFLQNRHAKVQADCLHWCLPGPIDSWNDLIMEMVVNG